MKAVALALLLGCAPAGMTTTIEHPASPDAPAGRLAGPPAALRPGAADISTPATPTSEHAGHGTSPSQATDNTQPANTAEPANSPEPTKSAEPAQSAEPTKKAQPKPQSKPRKQPKPPASKQVPGKTSTDKPAAPTPPAHQGHEGHH